VAAQEAPLEVVLDSQSLVSQSLVALVGQAVSVATLVAVVHRSLTRKKIRMTISLVTVVLVLLVRS